MPEEVAEDEEESTETQSNPLDDPELLRELYHDEGMTQAEIGEEYGVTSSTVSHYMSKHEVETRANVVTDERLEDPEWLREKYGEEELTMQEIADIIGCSDGTVMRRLHDIEDLEIRRSSVEKSEDEADDEDEADEAEADE
jgi:DNA-directed RNA polymerase specialized sigma subunit